MEAEKATIEQRFANYVIDNFIVGNVVIQLNKLMDGFYADLSTDVKVYYPILITLPLYFVLTFLYYFISEYYFSKTIGKLVTHTTVRSRDLNKPTTKQLIIRTFARLIPFEQISFVMDSKVGWHDRFSKTIVIAD
jgi:uncharacterized RDD family membrane protein YckC